MDLPDWWARLPTASREWLIAHNGEVVPTDLVTEIVKAEGAPEDAPWWVAESGPAGLLLSDEAIDLIEAFANAE